MNYKSVYDFDPDGGLECSHCGWSGPARGNWNLVGEEYPVLEAGCPACGSRILIIDATAGLEETRAAAAEGNQRAIDALSAILAAEERRKRKEP